MSDAPGSLVPVLAHSRRCGRAPASETRCQRGEPSRVRYALYVRFATAMPSWLRSASGTLSLTAASHRLMNTEATELTSGSSHAAMQGFGRGERAGGVVGQQGRYFQRHPAVDATRPVPDRSQQIGGPGQILQRQLEEQFLARLAFLDLLPDRRVVGRAVLDGMVEDRRVGREPRHGQLVDVALERAGL